MTEDEARKIAQHCIDAWPNGPKGYIWRELVIGLDYGPAVAAYKQLARESVKAPTTGQYMAHYNALNRPHTDARGIEWTGKEIGLDEYLSRVAARAAGGSQDATVELDNWNRWLTRKETA